MATTQRLEVIIIGAGPAAWSAATYLVRVGIKTLVIGRPDQSGLFDAATVWNYPGFVKGIAGRELLDRMMTQALEQGAEFRKNEVTHVEQVKLEFQPALGRFYVRLNDRQEFYADNLILAHGANYIKVNLPGEEEFKGRGVHYCAICDGPLYRDKEVLVIGNSNLAADEALQLAAIARQVKIVAHSEVVNFSPQYTELLGKQAIEVIPQRVSEIVGLKGVVTGLKTEPRVARTVARGQTLAYTADGVFIALGVASSFTFAQKLGLEMNGNFLKTDEHMRTSVIGVWAAGLARGGVNQIVKSVGEGGAAAVDIIKKIKDIPQYIDHS